MLTKSQRKAEYKGIETVRLSRIKNLRTLADKHGSWASLGRALGQQPTFLIAVAGPNPRRTFGEKLARSIESTLDLPAGWLDKDR